MNQILQNSLKQARNDYNKLNYYYKNKKDTFSIEFGNEIAEIPYGGNFTFSIKNRNFKMQSFKNFIKRKKYQLQFIFSFGIALIFLAVLFFKLYQNNQQEKISKELLNSYQLTTLYSNSGDYKVEQINSNPFVIGMIKIDKLQLSYPILSESDDKLLKMSVCRFAGPMPNESGNLCIVGHNYLDNRFFSRLYELNNGDNIEIYGLNGKKQDYKVFTKYEVEFDDLTCTNQKVNNDKIITLLTCNNSNQKKRLVVQAK